MSEWNSTEVSDKDETELAITQRTLPSRANKMKLYDFTYSGNAYKVRLMLSFLSQPYETQIINLAEGEQQSPEFLAINPAGKVPVLVNGDSTITDSNAILVYLAKTFKNTDLLPDDAKDLANVVSWLGNVSDDIDNGLNAARLVKLFGFPLNLESAQERGKAHLEKLEAYFSQNEWLAAGRVTIADIAMYPYVKMAKDGDVSLDGFDNIKRWLAAFEAQSGFIDLEG